MTRVVTMSDEHIGAPYADAFRDRDDVDALLRGAEHCIINGDLLEFLQTLGSAAKVLKQGEEWLGPLLQKYPDCVFHIVPGNHDDFPELKTLCEALNAKYGNVVYEEKRYLTIGDTLWTHGHLGFRPEWEEIPDGRPIVPPRNKLQTLGETPLNLIPGAVSQYVFPLEEVFDRTVAWFQRNAPEALEGVTRIAIGHVHTAEMVEARKHGDYKWFVTGCSAMGAPNFVLVSEHEGGRMTSHEMHRFEHPGVYDAMQKTAHTLLRAADPIVGWFRK